MIELVTKKCIPGSIRACCLLVLLLPLLLTPYSRITAHVSSDPMSGCPPIEEEIVDLEILGDMLAKTKAVGFLTKLGLKKDINKVLGRLEKYHDGGGPYTLEQLEEQYNLLLMKISAHLQDKDLTTHRHLCNAWLVIWEDLQDPAYFREHGP